MIGAVDIVGRINDVIEAARGLEDEYRDLIEQVHVDQRAGARNLVHYLALRGRDLGALQTDLDRLGLTYLNADLAHVAASLMAVRHASRRLIGDDVSPIVSEDFTPSRRFAEGHERLRFLATCMFGAPGDGSMPGIMVTMPSETAYEPRLVRDMVAAGMTCVRINCTQDDPSAWRAMVANVRAAEKETGETCRVFMDLGGPKMRTGPMTPGPRVLRLRPPKDARGRIVHAIPVSILPESEAPSVRASGYDATTGRYWTFGREAWLRPWIPLADDLLRSLRPGHRLRLTDARGVEAELRVVGGPGDSIRAMARHRLYLETGLAVGVVDEGGRIVSDGEVGTYPEVEQAIVLHVGDELLLHGDPRLGEPARHAPEGPVLECAHISSTLPHALERLEPGDPVLLDDGKIRCLVKTRRADGVVLEVTDARPEGTRLRANKGINAPESRLGLHGLTEQDLVDLDFISQNADGVELSFVNGPEDVDELYDRLEELGADPIDVVLKIETADGFAKLPSILLRAMRRPRVGVMIARGDLAVEAGWRNLSKLQEEILWMAEAAHVPVIWATQVLERMAKTGQPTRPELTDVTRATRAECVMLNKGPFLVETIRGLRTLMQACVRHQAGKTQLLGACAFHELDRPSWQ